MKNLEHVIQELFSMEWYYQEQYSLSKMILESGFVLEGHYRGEDYRIQREPIQNNSLHVEYDYCYLRPEDCFDISTKHDSFYCYPTKKNVVTKLAFATEELYLRSRKKA